METKHTPGPWFIHDGTRLKENGKYTGTFDIINTPEYILGMKVIGDAKPYGDNFPTHEEANANAHLMAAAPDMLKAIDLALNIKDLWAPVNYISIEHEGEAQALQSMLDTLKAAYQKATGHPITEKP